MSFAHFLTKRQKRGLIRGSDGPVRSVLWRTPYEYEHQEDGLMCKRVFAALLAIALCAGSAAAQDQRGSIEGVVKDASGAVLPGVTVTVANASGVKLDAVSDGEGVYRFPSLPPGS